MPGVSLERMGAIPVARLQLPHPSRLIVGAGQADWALVLWGIGRRHERIMLSPHDKRRRLDPMEALVGCDPGDLLSLRDERG
jgi:hypothetical protein